MAKRRRYLVDGQRPAQLDAMDQSRFWRRLDDLAVEAPSADRKASIDHLKASIRKVIDRAKWISTQVCRFMPQYTLHEERHFLNVLTIMDALVPDEVVAQLDPLDCALPILAAWTHDLGMALSGEEHETLLDESTEQGKHFASYRSRFDEELRQIARWRRRIDDLKSQNDDESKHESAQARKRVDAIEGHILASYLRDTHTEDDQLRRLRHWLEAIKQEAGDDNLFQYGNFDYQRTLALIGISHGRGALWLRRQLIDGGPDDRFFQPTATGESANLAFPGLLLALADVMDFDASRAPRILFKHFGIENDQSVLEWNKHLSIVGWRMDVDPEGKQQPDLLYSAECQHPVHEKAIREFKTWIDAELSAVRTELDAQRRQLPVAAQPRYDLHLPSQTRLDIRPARDPLTDQPKYVYHDLQFRLDQDEIQQLLMGESLYGDPGLCIRELLQNALDALELRELRLKMKQKGEAREPVDGELIRPGWVREPDGREEELRVTLDWGTDEETGQQWLRVTDNGVGMTEEVIKNYFTQIGKSYYRSPEFNQERAAMKAAGKVVSPISIFGIGILSCFMISERLHVRTRPGAANETDRAAHDITIAGSGSLFWFQNGSLDHQGTEITLLVRPRFSIEHNQSTFTQELTKRFDHTKSVRRLVDTNDNVKVTSDEIDPPLTAACHVVWPIYPVIIQTSAGDSTRIDERFHVDNLAQFNRDDLVETLDEWECPESNVKDLNWSVWDWVDFETDEATGSRIRLWQIIESTAAGGDDKDSTPRTSLCGHELAAFVDPLLCSPMILSHRIPVLVNGMHVDDVEVCDDVIEVMHKSGTRVWVDLRGPAAPSLTNTRQKAFAPPDKQRWREMIAGLFRRFHCALNDSWQVADFADKQNILCGFGWPGAFEQLDPLGRIIQRFDFVKGCSGSWHSGDSTAITYAYQRFCRERNYESSFRIPHLGKVCLTRDPRERASITVYSGSLDFKQTTRRPAAEEDACDLASVLFEQLRDKDVSKRIVDDESNDFQFAFSRTFTTLDRCAQSSSLQEGFRPQLVSSWPPFGLFLLRGLIGDSILLAPGLVEFEFENDDRTVSFTDPQGETPAELIQRGYDLTFPMTAVLLGQLRRQCSEWRSDRWYRPLGVASFLLPALHDVWPAHAEFLQETFGVPHIYCLLPRFELWSKRFSDWTDADWHDPENLSALWDLAGHLTGTPGQVLWARGTHNINELPKIGLPAPEFLVAFSK